jgi:LysM repeat protein
VFRANHRPEPFNPASGPEWYIPRAASERVLAQMEQWALRADGSAFVITGPAGIGKTMLLKVFARRIEGRLHSAYVPCPTPFSSDLYRWVLRELGESPGDDPEWALARVATSLQSRGSTLLLLIDDAMRLRTSTVKALTELGRSSGHAVGLVLAMFDGAGAERVISALRGKATLVSFDAPMSLSETAEFVQAELDRVGVSPEVSARFGAAAIEALHERSAGVPARLNTEAGRMLYAIEREGQLSLDMPASEAGALRRDPEAAPAESAAPTGATETPSPAPPSRETPPPRGQRKRPLRLAPALGWASLGVLAGVAFLLGLDVFRSAPVQLPPDEAPTLAAAQPGPDGDAPDATAEALPVVIEQTAPDPVPDGDAPDATAEALPVVIEQTAPDPVPDGDAPDAATEALPVVTEQPSSGPDPKASAGFAALANEGAAHPAARETAGVLHTVQPGETLSEIGRIYGVRIEDIVRVNQISDENTVFAGSRIAIPPRNPPLSAASAAPIEGKLGTQPATGESAAVLLARATDQLNDAQFRAALDTTEAALARLDSRPATSEADALRARLEVVAACSHLAFGRETAARASLERALRAEPDLELDPAMSSPNLIRIFRGLGADDSPISLAPAEDSS